MTQVPLPARFEALEQLPVPVMIASGSAMIYWNAALAALLGFDRIGLTFPAPVSTLISRFVVPADRPAVEAGLATRLAVGGFTEARWLKAQLPQGERMMMLRGSAGPGPSERTYVVLDANAEWEMKRLSEALAGVASELLRARSEEEVLETAVEGISRQGFNAAILLIGDGEFWHGPMRQDPQLVADGERIYGGPVEAVRYPLSTFPHWAQMLRDGRASFCLDIFERLERLHPPELVALMRQRAKPTRSLEAPILVDGAPFGVLALQSQALTPASTGTFELFGQLIGHAVESVRHQAVVQRQLEAVKRLQTELVRQERLSALGEAAAMVSHEARNPLGAIVNAVAVLKRNASKGTQQASLLGMIEEEALRLDGLVRDLLELARPLEPRFAPLDLDGLAVTLAETLRQRGEFLGKTLLVAPASGDCVLEADTTLVNLAVENLVRNALQAVGPGGTVRVSVRGELERVNVKVEDDGPGVAESDRARIFEAFYTTRATGTGLGLAVVRRVLDAHRASVSVGGSPLGGASFELHFPRRAEG